jgi:hypothetical protein
MHARFCPAAGLPLSVSPYKQRPPRTPYPLSANHDTPKLPSIPLLCQPTEKAPTVIVELVVICDRRLADVKQKQHEEYR